MSSPTFFIDRLAKADVVPTSPPVYLEYMNLDLKYIDFDLVGVELGWHGESGWYWMNPDWGQPKKVALLSSPS